MTVTDEAPAIGFGSHRRVEDARFIRGHGRYVDDVTLPGMLHGALLRSPYAHARIVSIDKAAALAVPGVQRVYTWEDVPRKRFTTAIHTDHLVDPDDTFVLDDTVRFVGQRVAAVLADTVAAAEEGCRRVVVDYEQRRTGGHLISPGRIS